MSGSPMQPLLPEPPAQFSGFGRGAIVAIDEARSDGTRASVYEHDRWALAGQADGMDLACRADLVDEGPEGSDRGPTPLPRILLCPTWAGHVRWVRATNLDAASALEVEGGGPGTRRPDIDGNQSVRPRSIERRLVHPRTSWWATILSA